MHGEVLHGAIRLLLIQNPCENVCAYTHIYRHVQAATVADVAAVQGGAASGSQPASSTPVANESEPAAAPR